MSVRGGGGARGAAPWRRAWGSLRTSNGFARQVSLLTLSNVVAAVITIVQGILVARVLGPADYGTAVLVMAVPAVIVGLIDARSRDAIVKYLSAFDRDGDGPRARAIVRLGYCVDLLIASVAVIAVAAVAHWGGRMIVKAPGYELLMVLYASSYLLLALEGTATTVLAVTHRFAAVAWITAGTALVRSALIVGLVLAGHGVWGVVMGNAAGLALMGVAPAVASFRTVRRRWPAGAQPWWAELRGYRREIGRFLAYNDLSGLFGVATKQLDVVILGYFRGNEAAGYYRLAKSLVGGASFLQRPLQAVVFPRIARLQDVDSAAERRRLLLKLVSWVSLPLAAASAVAVWLIPSVVRAAVGPEYEPAILASQFLFVAAALGLASFWVRPLYLSTNGEKAWAAATGSSAALFLLLAFPSVILAGHTGLAAASAFTSTVIAVALLVGARGRMGAKRPAPPPVPTLAFTGKGPE